MRVKLLRALCFRGVRNEPGIEIDLADATLVRELIALGKAEKVGAPAPAPSGAMTTENAADIVQGKARKGAKDVQ